MDTETTPATGSRVAERMITRNECAFLIGALHSGVANAISQVAQKYGCIFLNTNSSSPTEAGKDCHRIKFVWDGNGTNFAHAIVKNAIKVNGKNWVLLTNDYVWGHNTSKATRTLVEANGGKIVEELMVPQNTRDFSAYLLKVQQIEAQGGRRGGRRRRHQGAAPAGGAVEAEQDLRLGQQPAGLAGRLRPGAGRDLRRLRHELVLPPRPAGREGIRRTYQKAYPGVQIKVPGNVYYNGYMATRELLRCVEEAGTTNNIKVIKELEGRKMSARDRLQHHDAYIDPVTHQCQQTIYMATYNDQPTEKDDIFKILTQADPQDVMDKEAPDRLQAGELRGDADVRGVSVDFLANLLPHVLNGLSLGLLFALIALGLHADRGRDGGDQPRPRLASSRSGPTWRCSSSGRTRALAPFFGRFDALPLGARYSLALVLAPIAVGLFGMLLELCMRRTYGKDPLYGLLLTFGAALVIEELIRVAWGSRERQLPLPEAISGAVLVGDLIYARYRFFACALAVALIVLLWLFIEKTQLRRDHQGRRPRQRDGAGARLQPLAAAPRRLRARHGAGGDRGHRDGADLGHPAARGRGRGGARVPHHRAGRRRQLLGRGARRPHGRAGGRPHRRLCFRMVAHVDVPALHRRRDVSRARPVRQEERAG